MRDRAAWARAKAAAVAEHGGEVAFAGALQLGLETGHGAEVPGPVQPVLGVGERLQDADRDHARLEHPFQEGRAIGGLAGAQPFHHRFAVHDLDLLVLREGAVSGVCGPGEPGFQGGDEGSRTGWNAGLLGVARDVAVVLLPRHQLVAIVAVILAARDAQVA